MFGTHKWITWSHGYISECEKKYRNPPAPWTALASVLPVGKIEPIVADPLRPSRGGVLDVVEGVGGGRVDHLVGVKVNANSERSWEGAEGGSSYRHGGDTEDSPADPVVRRQDSGDSGSVLEVGDVKKVSCSILIWENRSKLLYFPSPKEAAALAPNIVWAVQRAPKVAWAAGALLEAPSP